MFRSMLQYLPSIDSFSLKISRLFIYLFQLFRFLHLFFLLFFFFTSLNLLCLFLYELLSLFYHSSLNSSLFLFMFFFSRYLWTFVVVNSNTSNTRPLQYGAPAFLLPAKIQYFCDHRQQAPFLYDSSGPPIVVVQMTSSVMPHYTNEHITRRSWLEFIWWTQPFILDTLLCDDLLWTRKRLEKKSLSWLILCGQLMLFQWRNISVGIIQQNVA